MIQNLKKFTIIDCTIRDGGHLNQWDFSSELVKDTYRASSNSGVDYFEVGYLTDDNSLQEGSPYGKWMFSRKEDVNYIKNNFIGSKISVMINYGELSINDILPKEEGCIDLIRIATYKEDLNKAIEFAESVLEKGYEVFLNLMAITYYTNEEIIEASRVLADSKIDTIYFADSFGSMMPMQVKEIVNILKRIPNKKIGFHAHNNLQMAFANAITALNEGASYIDATIYGMGRAAGNLPLEILIAYLQMQNLKKYNVIPLLDVIDKYYLHLKKQLKWGYSLPYMLSGIWDQHPKYSQQIFERKEYTIEESWNIMEAITKNQQQSSYSSSILDSIINIGVFNTNYKNEEIHKNSNSNQIEKIVDKLGYNFKRNRNEYTVEKVRNKQKLLHNIHNNKDFLILGNGPSLKEHRDKLMKFIIENELIVIGANYLENLFIPDYHVFINKKRFSKYIKYVNEKSKLFLSPEFSEEFIQNYTLRDYEFIPHLYSQEKEFDIVDNIIYTQYITVAPLSIALAHLMGARRIFVAGLDGYKNIEKGKVLFYPETDETNSSEIQIKKHLKISSTLDKIQDYLIRKNREEFHIITPTTYTKHYKGIDNYL